MKKKTTYQVPLMTTKRLGLRPLDKEDAAEIFAIHSDPQTLEYWGNEVFSELKEAEAQIQFNLDSVASGNSICWAIENPRSGGLIGTVTLFKLDEQNHRAEVGYILKRNFWGQGLMSEVLPTIIEYSFDQLQMHRLEADTDPENIGSLALLEKFGFKREGFFRDRWLVHGKWHDSVMLGLLKSEYEKKQAET
jgi:ribosomal-protein-alanine N-acetyltransferase